MWPFKKKRYEVAICAEPDPRMQDWLIPRILRRKRFHELEKARNWGTRRAQALADHYCNDRITEGFRWEVRDLWKSK